MDEEEYLEMKKKSKSKGKKFKKVGVGLTAQKNSFADNDVSTRKKKRMKQKRKKAELQNSEPIKSVRNASKKIVKISKRDELLNLKAECELSSLPKISELTDVHSADSNKLHSPNAASDGPEIVHFKGHVPKRKKSINIEPNSNEDGEDMKTKTVSMGEVRHQVLKFGMSGFDPEKRRKAEINIAIKLGAKVIALF